MHEKAPEPDKKPGLEQPKKPPGITRVVKARDAMKPGVMATSDADGRKKYKVSCDTCGFTVVLPFNPHADKEVLCEPCFKVKRIGKPSTRVFRRKGVVNYKTECDNCESVEATSFLPKGERPFLCKQCMRSARKETGQKSIPADTSEDVKATEPPNEEPQIQAQPENQVEQPKESQETFSVGCRSCGRKIQLRFKPKPFQPITCHHCFSKQHRGNTSQHDTRVLTQIECSVCGKSEILGLVPTRRTQPICASCLKEKKLRREHDQDHPNR